MDDPLALFGRGWEYGVALTTADAGTDRIPRLRALGNAIVPQVAYVIFLSIQEAMEQARPAEEHPGNRHRQAGGSPAAARGSITGAESQDVSGTGGGRDDGNRSG